MNFARRRVLSAFGAGVVLGAAHARAESPTIRMIDERFTQGGWARGEATSGIFDLVLDGIPVAVEQGRFFIAFDRDAGPRALLSANRGAVNLPLPIAPRAWRIETIGAPFHPPGVPDAEFARLRAAELARIAAARVMVTGARGWQQRFVWPIATRISGLFGAQRIYRGPNGQPAPGAYHAGIDLAAITGTVYRAPADGVVILAAAAAPFTLEGHLLMVDHGAGLNSAFLHGSELLVSEGDSVRQGQPIGRVGMTGRATGPHLHWALRWHDARLDPLLMTGPMPSFDPS